MRGIAEFRRRSRVCGAATCHWTDIATAIPPEVTERPFKRHARIPVAHVAVKIEIGQRRDDQNLGGKIFKEPRHARDKFRELKTGEGAGDLNLPAELPKRDAALAGQASHQPRVSRVGPVENENAFALQQQARQEVVTEPRRLSAAMENRQAARRDGPRFGRWQQRSGRVSHKRLRKTAISDRPKYRRIKSESQELICGGPEILRVFPEAVPTNLRRGSSGKCE